MRYDLGFMDMYPIEVCGTRVENDPMFKLTFRSPIDPVKLEDAIYRAIKFHPLFGTRVRYDGYYYLETNNRPVKLTHAAEGDRPLEFGARTNGYPWQICWDGCSFTFEWCHGIADGVAALAFLRTMLSIYCGMKYPVVPRKIMLGPGLEPFADYREKGDHFETQPRGFSAKYLPAKKRRFVTDCHCLEAKTEEILKLAGNTGSSVSMVLTVLLSKAFRRHLPAAASNRNVACNVVLDLRRPLQYETMHNCVEYKRFTYQDRHDSMSFEETAREYKTSLDHARERKNVIRLLTDRMRTFNFLFSIRSRRVRAFAYNMTGILLKHTDCNFVFSYLGKADFPEAVMEQVEDLQFRVWHDFSECIVSAVDFGGTFKVNFSENFIEKGIVEDFMELSREQGIHWKNTENLVYTQASFINEDEKIQKQKGEETHAEERAPRELPVPAAGMLGGD